MCVVCVCADTYIYIYIILSLEVPTRRLGVDGGTTTDYSCHFHLHHSSSSGTLSP